MFNEDIPAQSDLPFDPLLLVYEGGLPGTMTLEESCLDTICAALALHTCLHRTTTTSMLSTQECIYTTHSPLQYI